MPHLSITPVGERFEIVYATPVRPVTSRARASLVQTSQPPTGGRPFGWMGQSR